MMSPFSVVVVREFDEYPFAILGIPKEDVAQVFATGRADQSFNEWMRLWRIGDGLNLIASQGCED